MTSAASSLTSCVATSRISTTTTWLTPKPTLFSRNNVSAPYIRCPNMEDENELIALRRKKLETLRAKGIEPFGASFDVSGSIAEVREQFKEGETRHVAGRITAHRDMGKSHFLDLRDATGRIQIYIHAK